MKTSSQKRAELKALSKRSATSIYDMLRIANELLADHEYVDQFGGEIGLIEHMEQEEFSHLRGAWSLPAMLRAYRKNPSRTTWQEYQYSVQAMIDLAAPAKEASEMERTNWKALCKDVQAKLAQAEATVEEYRLVNGDLRTKCDGLLAECGELRGRVAVLETLAKGRAA